MAEKTTELKNQCQRLASVGIFEIIRRESEKIEATKFEHCLYNIHTTTYLLRFRYLLPNVGKSNILDNLSQFKSSERNGSVICSLE